MQSAVKGDWVCHPLDFKGPDCGKAPGFSCPKGTTCQKGEVPICCDDKMLGLSMENVRFAATWKANINPTCDRGKTVVKNGTRVLLGLECAHNFCPKGSSCVKKEHLAHCCK